MSNTEKPTSLEFRPRPSNGRLWVGSIGLITLLLFIVPMLFALGEIPILVFAIFVLIGLAVTSPILLVAWKVPTMRYELGPDTLTLHFRPFMKDEIPLDSITSVRIEDQLRISLLASFRFPGLAVMDVLYRDEGQVRMCATSASKRILLITAGRKKYGITPDDEEGFLSELAQRLNNPEIFDTDVQGRVLRTQQPVKQ